MQWTRTDGVRRWIVVVGLIVGPALTVLSIVINLNPPESMRASFDAMAAHPGLIVTEAFLETFGFMIVLAALRHRGGALGTWCAALSIVGIVGFALSNTTGFQLAELAALPDRDAAFATAKSITTGDLAGTIGTVEMALEIVGQVGMLLVIVGLIRARIIRIWPLVFGIVGIVLNAAIGIMVTTLIADLLLLAAGTWIALAVARSSHEQWLGLPAAVSAPRPASYVG
jgi:hypothetical protein